MESTMEAPVKKLSIPDQLAALTERVASLEELAAATSAALTAASAKIAALEVANSPRNSATREMTDDDARRVLTGDLAEVKHKDAAAKLGLSYGQVYSCRLEFTFKHIHKEMKAAGKANPWVK